MKRLITFLLLVVTAPLCADQTRSSRDLRLETIINNPKIGITPFSWRGASETPLSFHHVITANLYSTGQVDPVFIKKVTEPTSWSKKLSYMLLGQIDPIGKNRYAIQARLFSIVGSRKKEVLGFRWETDNRSLRQVAHQISDKVHEIITGLSGTSFSGQIAYVTQEKTTSTYRLIVADPDGFNPRVVLQSEKPLHSPQWSNTGTHLLYVSVEHDIPTVISQNVASGKRTILAKNPMLTGRVAWSPDNQRIALSLSRNGNIDIYIFEISTQKVTRLTNNRAEDTDPAWSPDGQHLVFTSNRTGSRHIYRMSISGEQVKRLTFEGKENTQATYLPQNNKNTIAFVTDDGNGKKIAILNETDDWRSFVLTSSGKNLSPTFSPNGAMILYVTEQDGKKRLATISSNGKISAMLNNQSQSVVTVGTWSGRSH